MSVLTHSDLEEYYDQHDLILWMSLAAVHKMQGERVLTLADEILSFVSRHGPPDPLQRYLKRVQALQSLQETFEKTGRYAASRYQEVPAVELGDYNLALLLSFVVANHRFEILERLTEFFDAPTPAPRRLLSVGFGTGYELKVAQDRCPTWEIEAFDRSPEAAGYASKLLRHFGCDTACLRLDTFPLEADDGIEAYEQRYGKVVLCEVLEHLEQPAHAIRNLARALAPGGHMFLTMAINLAQEDHIYLYRSIDEARQQVTAQGLEIEREWITPVTVRAFQEVDRARIFRKGNFVCVARRPAEGASPR